ncbi:hypothetical protein R69749_07502 [Paraburkholderia domus]|jgi:Domain of unknown function (DUF1840).|nr:DUF1840 domain-containing protein [Burkholderia sp. R-69749]MCI0150238.1 DUF1840 family protein [Paraburkholderia sediminicola]CAE6889174.1 hypothetical protein R69749_07502 [Paraburkholderia domus]
MRVTFQSPATPDRLMLRELAQYLPGIVGKRLDIRGVIQHDELPRAISRLEMGYSDEEKAEIAENALNYTARAHLCERGSGIAQRAWPLLDMMRQGDLQQAEIIWRFQGWTGSHYWLLEFGLSGYRRCDHPEFAVSLHGCPHNFAVAPSCQHDELDGECRLGQLRRRSRMGCPWRRTRHPTDLSAPLSQTVRLISVVFVRFFSFCSSALARHRGSALAARFAHGTGRTAH